MGKELKDHDAGRASARERFQNLASELIASGMEATDAAAEAIRRLAQQDCSSGSPRAVIQRSSESGSANRSQQGAQFSGEGDTLLKSQQRPEEQPRLLFQQLFLELRSKGMEPNEAAAEALRQFSKD